MLGKHGEGFLEIPDDLLANIDDSRLPDHPSRFHLAEDHLFACAAEGCGVHLFCRGYGCLGVAPCPACKTLLGCPVDHPAAPTPPATGMAFPALTLWPADFDD